MEKMKEYLPLGSIIELEGQLMKSMIVARGVVVDAGGIRCYYEYGACSYPEGMTGKELLYFNGDAVECVVSRGYTDEQEERIVKAMQQMESDMEPADIVKGVVDAESVTKWDMN